MALIMNNQRHSFTQDILGSFRTSVPGIWGKDQIYIFHYTTEVQVCSQEINDKDLFSLTPSLMNFITHTVAFSSAHPTSPYPDSPQPWIGPVSGSQIVVRVDLLYSPHYIVQIYVRSSKEPKTLLYEILKKKKIMMGVCTERQQDLEIQQKMLYTWGRGTNILRQVPFQKQTEDSNTRAEWLTDVIRDQNG